MRYPENGWYEENDYIAFASASLRKKKAQKAFRGLPRLQSGTIFQVLWHNPAYHYVENKWRCSFVDKHRCSTSETHVNHPLGIPTVSPESCGHSTWRPWSQHPGGKFYNTQTSPCRFVIVSPREWWVVVFVFFMSFCDFIWVWENHEFFSEIPTLN